jgi:DMSO/TMAO reductase YedYZ molybdopterin-dependent catalytic subunit
MSATEREHMGIASSDAITTEELQLAARNHGMPLEALRYDVTPVGLHYLLIHFDIPTGEARTWTLQIGGLVDRPVTFSMADLMDRPAVSRTVTMECAGNGRARLHPRPLSQPWLSEAVGTAEWTGTPLAPILEEARIGPGAVDVIFEGADHGTQGEVEQDYERSLSVADATHDDVMLAYAINGTPLPPQHGYPLRLVVPGWYGMTNVKWLRRITVVGEAFDGFQMQSYRVRSDPDDPGTALTRMEPRALMVPPGFPDFFSRRRIVEAGEVELSGRAWSGWGPISSVEVSVDDGATWDPASLGPAADGPVWRGWSFGWSAAPGDHVVMCRATDAVGRSQPAEEPWNQGGFANTTPQRIEVTVR